jgi:hypothetical protein
MVGCHCGPLGDGERAVKPIKGFGSPLMDVIGPMPYSALNAMLDDAHPRRSRRTWSPSRVIR